jgi:hypothetical protein
VSARALVKAWRKLYNTSKAADSLLLGDEAAESFNTLTDGRVITESA